MTKISDVKFCVLKDILQFIWCQSCGKWGTYSNYQNFMLTSNLHSAKWFRFKKKVAKIQKNRKFYIRFYSLFFKTSTLGVSENV
jgi:hypothetical protein